MLLRIFEKRLRGYRAIGYARGEAPLGYAESADEATVEYNEDVLAELDRNDDFGWTRSRPPVGTRCSRNTFRFPLKPPCSVSR
jgi:hypothetical protein